MTSCPAPQQANDSPGTGTGLLRSFTRLPLQVVAAMLLLAVFQMTALFNARGVADQEGYPFNPSRLVSINTYEDDGAICLAGALGLIGPDEKFSHYFNVGGPFIHIGRVTLLLGQSLGLVKLHDDPAGYITHPEDFRGVWRFFGLYKLFGFVIWLPALGYWICRRTTSRGAGIIAAWFIAATPFLTAFEPRLKVDSAALSVGLAALLFQIEYALSGRAKYIVASSVLLGFGLAMKFSILPLGGTLAISLFIPCQGSHVSWKERIFLGLRMAAVILSVFLLSNPFIFKSLLKIAHSYLNYVEAPPKPTVQMPLLEALAYRIVHLGGVVGATLNLFVLPSLFFVCWKCLRKGFRAEPGLVLLLSFLVLDFAYLALFIRSNVATLTYYFLTPGIFALMLAAVSFDSLHRALGRWNWAVCLLLAVILLSTLRGNVSIADYMSSPSNRQRALSWIEANFPDDSRIGVPFKPGEQTLNSIIRLDPFRYDLVPAGTDIESVGVPLPDAVLAWSSKLAMEAAAPAGMGMAALFDSGNELPRDASRDLYQDELYAVFTPQADNPHGPLPPSTPENLLGRAMRRDGEPSFSVLQFHALSFFPQSVDMLRKQDGTLLPVSWRSFTRALRGSGTLSFVHQIPPIVMQLWGVKYIMAHAGDGSPFVEQTERNARYALVRAWQGRFAIEGSQRDLALYRCGTYRGQAFFIPDARPGLVLTPGRGRYLPREIPVPLYGTLPNPERSESVEIALSVEAQGEMDLLLGEGENRVSILLASGHTTVSIPFEALGGNIRYELNPAVSWATARITSLAMKPLSLLTGPSVTLHSIDASQCFATAATDTPGRVVLSLPYDRRAHATINGKAAACVPGPANTTAVAVPSGSSFVHVWTN